MNEITIEYGKKIIKDNPFYFTLHLMLKYYFNNTNEYYFFTFLQPFILEWDTTFLT